MAEQLIKKYGRGIGWVQLIPSSGGVFEVTVDDALVFSKKELGRFPEDDELEQAIDR